MAGAFQETSRVVLTSVCIGGPVRAMAGLGWLRVRYVAVLRPMVVRPVADILLFAGGPPALSFGPYTHTLHGRNWWGPCVRPHPTAAPTGRVGGDAPPTVSCELQVGGAVLWWPECF